MTNASSNDSEDDSEETPDASARDSQSGMHPPPLIVDEFGKPYAKASNSRKPRENRFKKLAAKYKISQQLNVVLTAIIAVSTVSQTVNSCNNNISTSQQTQQLITAAGISAYAAQQNLQAARDFASSARSINNGISDATEKLGLQVQGIEDARRSSIEQSKQALDATIANSRADLRPWVGVENAIPKNYVVFPGQHAQTQLYVDFTIKNYGRSAAEKAFIYADFILLLPSNRNDGGCKDSYPETDLGYSVLPTQTLPLTHAMNFSREYLLKALSRQQFSTTLSPRVIGCVVYAEGTPKIWHHTPFSYALQLKDGSEITADMERIDDTKMVLKELSIDPGPAN